MNSDDFCFPPTTTGTISDQFTFFPNSYNSYSFVTLGNYIFRINNTSGTAWRLVDDTWILIKEQTNGNE